MSARDVSAADQSTTTATGWTLGGVAVVLVLGGVVRFLEQTVPDAAAGTAFGDLAKAVEYPVYAIALGLLGNAALTRLGLRDRLAGGFPGQCGRGDGRRAGPADRHHRQDHAERVAQRGGLAVLLFSGFDAA
jgi:hypothetical protein